MVSSDVGGMEMATGKSPFY